MYGGFTVLRTAVEEDVAPPAFDDLIGRAGRIRRRRLSLVLLVTSLVVAAGLALAHPVHQIVGPGPTPAPTAGPPFEVADLVFTSARDGYVLLGPCTGQAACTTTRGLAGTRDGGRTWHRITLPVDVGSDASLLLDAHGSSVSVVLGDQRYVSGDGGRHWSRAHWLRDAGPIPNVPPGQVVTVFCPVDQARCEQRLAALDPVLGIQRPLAHQPELPPGTEGAASGLVVGDGTPLWGGSRAPPPPRGGGPAGPPTATCGSRTARIRVGPGRTCAGPPGMPGTARRSWPTRPPGAPTCSTGRPPAGWSPRCGDWTTPGGGPR